MFHKVTTTEGIQDASGEQVEVFSTGDKFQIASHAVTPHNWEPGQELVVSYIEYNDEDPNDFVLYYVTDEELVHVHRIDVEHISTTERRTGSVIKETSDDVTDVLLFVAGTDEKDARESLIWEDEASAQEAAEDSSEPLNVYSVTARINWDTLS